MAQGGMDFSEVVALAADLAAVAKESPRKARQVVQQTGLRTKAQWRKDAAGNPFGKQYTATIDYDLTGSALGDEIGLEIGPNIERYGGKTGKGGLVPSAGLFDDPLSDAGIRVAPDRSRRKAELFAAADIEQGLLIALDQIMSDRGL